MSRLHRQHAYKLLIRSATYTGAFLIQGEYGLIRYLGADAVCGADL